MGTDEYCKRISKYAYRLIKLKANQLIERQGFPEYEREDLVQIMLVDLWVRQRNYDPKQGSRHAFERRVIDNKIASILEAMKAQKRDYRLCNESLDAEVVDSDGNYDQKGETIDGVECFRRLQRIRCSMEESLDRAIDLERVLSKLSPIQRRICELLTYLPITEISKIMGLSRQTIYRHKEKISAFFKEVGMENYW